MGGKLAKMAQGELSERGIVRDSYTYLLNSSSASSELRYLYCMMG